MKTYIVLFTRQYNENATTPMDPVCEWKEGMVDLTATDKFCAASDWDLLVECNLHELRKVTLPDWLPVSEWVEYRTKWKWVWGCGVKQDWPEQWQREISKFNGVLPKVIAAKLLSTKKFRSAFRQSLRDQLVEWIENPEKREYDSPFSIKQWKVLQDARTTRLARQIDTSLYHRRGDYGVKVEKIQ